MMSFDRKAFVLLCSFIVLTKQCSNRGYSFENYLGTFTPYRVVSNQSFDKIDYEGCTPKKIWMMVRHGTRNPSRGHIDLMSTRLPEIRDLIVENEELPNAFIKNRDLDLFRKWKFNLDRTDEKKLAHEGEEEMLLLAERMQSRFPSLFDNAYSNTSYKFKYTFSQRTKKSAFYFAAGLFGRKTARDVWYPEPSKKDPILRFYKLCDRWHRDIKQNPATKKEQFIFENGPDMKKVVQDVDARLDLKNELNTDDVKIMYKTCAFETAWNKKSKSPWCTAFSKEDLKVLEYATDLKFYWQDGYGYELTYKQACPAFSDMVNFLGSEEKFPKVTTYFTHSGTLLKMLAHVGLYQEKEHLRAKNFRKMLSRKWRTSLIDTFATNLAFVSFSCGSDDDKVLMLHQENVVRWPSCPDSDLCDWKEINNFYYESINNCQFNSMCSTTDKFS